MSEKEAQVSQTSLEDDIINKAKPTHNGEWFDGQMATLREKNSKYDLLSHSVRDAFIASKLAESEGMSGEDLIELSRAGLLHDIGKTELPDKLFSEPAKTEDDFIQIRTHLRRGFDRVKPYLEYVATIIAAHHEFQENPYPRQKYRDEDTDPKLKRLQFFLALADQTDAMMSDRPYHKALSPEGTKEKLIAMFKDENLIDLAIRTRASILI